MSRPSPASRRAGGVPRRLDPLSAHPTRARALALAAAQPGIHFGALRRELGVGNGAAVHHLRALVAAGLLVERRQPRAVCYFLPGAATAAAAAWAPALRSPRAREILQALAAEPAPSLRSLGRRLGIPTVQHHLWRLMSVGLVERRRGPRGNFLQATPLGCAAVAARAPWDAGLAAPPLPAAAPGH